MCIFAYKHTTFFNLGRFFKKWADNQCSLITKGSNYYIKHISLHLITIGVDWPEIGRLMEYLSCLIFAHTAFLLCIAKYRRHPCPASQTYSHQWYGQGQTLLDLTHQCANNTCNIVCWFCHYNIDSQVDTNEWISWQQWA